MSAGWRPCASPTVTGPCWARPPPRGSGEGTTAGTRSWCGPAGVTTASPARPGPTVCTAARGATRWGTSGRATSWPASRSSSTEGRASDLPQDRGDDAQDRGVGAVDRVVRRVVRQQPHLTVLALERLDGGLAVDQRGHDVAVLGRLLLADHDVVAVADRRLDHRVAGHLEQEERALAHELLGQREDVLHPLLGQDRA